ncbi:MAG: hypothetical protein JWR38_2290 [Mucilaginibacter sp.]|nr:hypothetical protein [Mucilaginibacter sp.]
MIIYISLFYSKSYWGALARSVITAMNMLEKQKQIKAFNVIFGTERGDNISLVIYTAGVNEKKACLDYLKPYFHEFFTKQPSPQNNSGLARTELFMNFPNNSIQFNLYKNDFIPENQEPDLTVEHFAGLSRLFLANLPKKSFRQWLSEPVTGLFISQALLLKAFEVDPDEGRRIFKYLLLQVNRELRYYDTLYLGTVESTAAMTQKNMQLEFEQNSEFLTDVLVSIFDTPADDLVFDDDFYNTYYRLCCNSYSGFLAQHRISGKLTESQQKKKKNWLQQVIRSQIGLLGLPPANELLLFYFSKKAFHVYHELEVS